MNDIESVFDNVFVVIGAFVIAIVIMFPLIFISNYFKEQNIKQIEKFLGKEVKLIEQTKTDGEYLIECDNKLMLADFEQGKLVRVVGQ